MNETDALERHLRCIMDELQRERKWWDNGAPRFSDSFKSGNVNGLLYALQTIDEYITEIKLSNPNPPDTTP